MRDRSIILRDQEVRAILQGRKTQLRRPVKPQPDGFRNRVVLSEADTTSEWAAKQAARGRLVTAQFDAYGQPLIGTAKGVHCHISHANWFGAPADRLWVQECWGVDALGGASLNGVGTYHYEVAYRSGGAPLPLVHQGNDDADPYGRYCTISGHWRSSTTMPRWASRLMLLVTQVRIERFQDISEEDAQATTTYVRVHGGWAPEPRHKQYKTPWFLTARDALAHEWVMRYGRESWHANPWVYVGNFELTQ